MMIFKKLVDGLVNTVYPSCCITCEKLLVEQEDLICLDCFIKISSTDFHLFKDNPISRKFYGKVPINHAMSCFPFVKKGRVQAILHHLKYRDEAGLSYMIGLWYGRKLNLGGLNETFDLVLPVPLHPKKFITRGYNQSDGFAKGLAVSLNIEWNPTILIRKKETETQTKKNRIERWLNVKGIFEITEKRLVENKNILLVDDVVTTGATLESCANSLVESKPKSISIATIAYA